MNRTSEIQARVRRVRDGNPFLGIPDRIRLLLAEKGWSGRELSRRAGIAESHVGLLLRGQQDPKLMTMYRISVACGVRFEWLCLGTGRR